MTKRKVSNLLALAVLSLLTERPMHPYEISVVMRQRGLSDSIKLNYGSLYSVIDMLLREALIVPLGTQREGRHPERTVYATTEAGRTELFDWLRSLVRTPATEYTQFAAGLSFLAHFSPAEAAALLKERTQHLSEKIRTKRSAMDANLQHRLDQLFLIEDEYALALLEAELAWVQKLIREIQDGTLTETADGQLRWKILHPDLAFMQGEEEMEHHETHEAPMRKGNYER